MLWTQDVFTVFLRSPFATGLARSDRPRLRRRIANVAGRRQRQQCGLGVGRNIERLHETLDRLPVDGLAPRQRLQLLVGLGHAEAAHHGLDGFGEDFPAVVEILFQPRTVDFQLAKPLEDCLVSYEAVTKTYPHVAQHSGVSQVALPARYRQL